MSRFEANSWIAIAKLIDRDDTVHLYNALSIELARGFLSPEVYRMALRRLRDYDNPLADYGPYDDYANLDGQDSVLAALWLALEADDTAIE